MAPSRILVHTGTRDCLNMGDVAMLQIAVGRLSDLWPKATIAVLTDDPQALALHCPSAVSVPLLGCRLYFADHYLWSRLRSLPPSMERRLLNLETTLRRYLPAVTASVLCLKMRFQGQESSELSAFFEALYAADLIIICGQGTITDGNDAQTNEMLRLLEVAILRGIPAAMFGQGIGPLQAPDAMHLARAVLPRVDLIALREGLGGAPLLRSLGVAEQRIAVTGDDAIEMAYQHRATKQGNGIGVNLRVAAGAGVDSSFIDKLRPVLQEFACNRRAPLIPVPISNHRVGTNDSRTIQQLLLGYDDPSQGGRDLDTPLKVIRQIARCRIVLTGAYHAAVFALSQGIPVVGLAKSPYVVQKFLGLTDQFGAGCDLVLLDGPDLYQRVIAAMEKTWMCADKLRSPLQEAALRQIAASRGAYQQIYEQVTFRKVAA
jgi:colanic acid/amylovoran biosynthesis protein